MAKKPAPTCGTCRHIKEGIYYEPVCYKLTFLDGRTWATKVTHKKKACNHYSEM